MKNNTNNQGESFDFSPDLSLPKENIKLKTSVNFDKDTSLRLQNLRENGVNVSNYINKVVANNFRLEKELLNDVYGKNIDDFQKVELWLHRDIVVLFKLLELHCGAIPLANKLAEIIANDVNITDTILNGDCSCYGANTLNNSLNAIKRGIERIQHKK